jgi:hypothetical protein
MHSTLSDRDRRLTAESSRVSLSNAALLNLHVAHIHSTVVARADVYCGSRCEIFNFFALQEQ